MTRPPLDLDPTGPHSFQAYQDGFDFTVRETTEGWKTEGNPVFDGLLFDTLGDLTSRLEGRDQ